MAIRKRYSFFPALIQKTASSRFGSWLFARILPDCDRIFIRLSGGRTTMTGLLAGLPMAMVTTTGAKSGLPRTLPLLYIHDESTRGVFAFIASNWGQEHNPAWYYNLKANPRATCSIHGQAREYLAHEASGEEYERFWQYAANTYLGYPLYKQRAANRRIPIMVMTPV